MYSPRSARELYYRDYRAPQKLRKGCCYSCISLLKMWLLLPLLIVIAACLPSQGERLFMWNPAIAPKLRPMFVHAFYSLNSVL